ncbi:MAG: hypothetical protein Q4E60_02750 [Bacteroidales bacterium]|nr:hypothetical protein [Bacteroidales bacterium]
MKKILSIIFLFCYGCVALAQTQAELITAYTDRDCYLAGERLCVRVDVSVSGKPSPSRVAYIEIADTHRMYAQCMVALKDGQGWAEISLPTSMHSGCYQLAAYTRASIKAGADALHHSIIGVVNADKLSRQDDIVIMPAQSDRVPAIQGQYKAGETAHIALPDANTYGGCISIKKIGLETNLTASSISELSAMSGSQPWVCPEVEGHIVRAKVAEGVNTSAWQTRLALVGKAASLYDGKRQQDGSYLFYTTGIYGNLPVMVNAYDSIGRPVRMELESPYLAILPKTLPKLTVYCQEETLRKQASVARKQAIINQQMFVDSLNHSVAFMNAQPELIYDLDEYTKMDDVKELLLEFVKGIRTKREHGVSQLFTYNPDTKSYSKWAALVLLDGMPVYDIDEILKYEAHLIKYIQIYSGIFNFGSSFCCGVISFITRGGRLSNYKLKAGEELMSYFFPQYRPDFVNYIDNHFGTILWIPSYQGKELTLSVPSEPGIYQITFQAKSKEGKQIASNTFIEVTH